MKRAETAEESAVCQKWSTGTDEADQKGDYMRKTMIYCDKCRTEIMGDSIRIIPEYYDRDNGRYEPYLEQKMVVPSWVERMLKKEFCEGCAKKIFDFALNVAVRVNEDEPNREETRSDSGDVDWDVAVERIKAANQSDGIQCQDGALCPN